jgi:ribosomal protein L37AE/L43A
MKLENGTDFSYRLGSDRGISIKPADEEGRRMESVQDYFFCSNCHNRDFKLIYNFSIRFYGVNFSDDLIYDRLTDEIYQCAKCSKTFTKAQIDEALSEFKKIRKREGLKESGKEY